jgi:hypothetical protein
MTQLAVVPQPTAMSFLVEIGNAPFTLPRGEAKAFADLGMTNVRLTDSAVLSHPEEGIWRFLHSHLQDNIKIMLDCGIKVDLGTGGCPAHMAFGQTTYYPLTAGPTCWNLDERGVAYPAIDPATGQPDPRHGQHFADHRPWVIDPPHMTGWYEYGQRLADALGPYVNSHAWGNELGGDFYNPLVHTESRWDEAYARMWYEGAAPFFRGILSVNPDAFLTAPDADGDDSYRRGLNFIAEFLTYRRAIRAASLHPYAWPGGVGGTAVFPDDSIRRIKDEFRPMFDLYGDPSLQEWWSECGDDGTGLGPQWLRTVLSWERRPNLITWGNRDQFFVVADRDERARKNDYTLSVFGEEYADVIRNHRADMRRRAVQP